MHFFFLRTVEKPSPRPSPLNTRRREHPHAIALDLRRGRLLGHEAHGSRLRRGFVLVAKHRGQASLGGLKIGLNLQREIEHLDRLVPLAADGAEPPML